MLNAPGKYLLLTVLLIAAAVAPAQDSKLDDVIRVDTELVVLRAGVRDRQGRAVTGLKKENFKIFEDGVEQPIDFFSGEESPVSWGLVLDRSGSMMDMMYEVYQASLHVIDEGTDKDEMFIVAFNEKAELLSPFISDRHKLENSTLGLRAYGQTALYDAVEYALGEFSKGKFRKKVLVVVTDGEDNSSDLSFRKLVEEAEEEEVIIYTVGMFGSGIMSFRSSAGVRGELEKLSEVTGGAAHFPSNPDDCKKVMKEIALEVSQQYSLGYYPTNTDYDDKWRAIQLKVQRVREDSGLIPRTRNGYYARKKRTIS